MMRAFIALKLPTEIIESLRVLQTDLKKLGLKLRWVRPENIHLTLKYLGEITVEDVRAAKHVIREVARRQSTFSLEARGLGAFPTVKKARVLWSGIHGDVGRLNDLWKNLERALGGIGFEPEQHTFRGHITLGRVKGRADGKKLALVLSELGSYASPAWAVDRLILFKSDLKPSGAIYTELASEGLT